MTTDQFCYWLHGWTEINGGGQPAALQWQIIKDHLDLVFAKVTPTYLPSGYPVAMDSSMGSRPKIILDPSDPLYMRFTTVTC